MRISLAIIAAALFAAGCGPNEAILKSSRNTNGVPEATLAPSKTTFEQELGAMRDAGFDYIFIIRRKDGGEFADDDRKFLRETIPVEINRRVAADGGKAFILGSGFAIDNNVIAAWRKRFNVEEESKKVERVESQR